MFHPPLVDIVSSLPESLQDTVRSGLLSAVLARQNDLRTLAALGLLLREVVEKDNENGNFEEWIEPLGELIKWMGSEEEGTADSGTFLSYEYSCGVLHLLLQINCIQYD